MRCDGNGLCCMGGVMSVTAGVMGVLWCEKFRLRGVTGILVIAMLRCRVAGVALRGVLSWRGDGGGTGC